MTVVDGATARSQGTIGGGGYALELLNGGKLLYEVSGSELRLVDLERNVEAGEIPLNGRRGRRRNGTAAPWCRRRPHAERRRSAAAGGNWK